MKAKTHNWEGFAVDPFATSRKGYIGTAKPRFASNDAARKSHIAAIAKFTSMFRRLAEK